MVGTAYFLPLKLYLMDQYFIASYLSTQAATYFNRVLLVSSLAQHPDAKVAELRETFFQSLKNGGSQYINNIIQANNIYTDMDLEELDLPRLPEDYFHWVDAFRKNLRATTTENSTEQLIVDYAYHMACICTDLALLGWSLYLHLHAPAAPDQMPQIKSSISDLQRSKLIWSSTAILLGREEDMHFMWAEWQTLNHLLDQLHAFDLLNKPENQEAALNFADALLPKFHETVDNIISKLKVL